MEYTEPLVKLDDDSELPEPVGPARVVELRVGYGTGEEPDGDTKPPEAVDELEKELNGPILGVEKMLPVG